ncbi:MAG: tetratricopeptide repeat protein [Limisphaerales bacterium]
MEPVSTPTNPFRKWLFRALAGIIIPLLVLGILEAALRLGGYGYSTNFFRPMQISGQEFLVQNDSFGFRFFPPDIARTPATLRMSAKKAPGTYRIFIMGESAALGDPEPAFGAGRYLDVLLRERFPAEKFEVINVAMTAINSHAILPIARDCARQDGDLWIIYMGNNEMVGPFGAATVFGAQAPPWQLVRLNLALQKFRLGQLLVDLGRKLKGKEAGREAWSGMKMFSGNLVPPDDPRKETVYRNFDKNLRDILRAGLDSGARILLSTVAVNLKDCPPFGSQINNGISTRDHEEVERLLAAGNLLAQQGDWSGAVKSYQQADQLKPQSADLDFRLGDGLWQLTNGPAARLHFDEALDLDCLPFRADSRINSLISNAGKNVSSSQLTLFDATAALENNLTNNIPGRENFYEHVHLNFDGNYRLALAWAGQVAEFLPSSITKSADAAWGFTGNV